jgi:hypothetical protein
MEVTELSYFEIWRKMFFYTVLSVFAISLCMLADIFNLVVDPKRVWRSMRAMWYDQTPLLLSLLALVTACGLILVGQWYFEPAGLLAYHPGLGGY